MAAFSPVHTLRALRDAYYDVDGPPDWERLADILHCPNDEALQDHVKELSNVLHGSFWAKAFLSGEHYQRKYTRRKGGPSKASIEREKKLRRIWSMLEKRLTYVQMAEQTGYSITTIHELIKTMERRSILTRDTKGGRAAYTIHEPYQWVEGDDDVRRHAPGTAPG